MATTEVKLNYAAYLGGTGFSEAEMRLAGAVVERGDTCGTVEYRAGWTQGACRAPTPGAVMAAMGAEWREGYAHGLEARTTAFAKRAT